MYGYLVGQGRRRLSDNLFVDFEYFKLRGISRATLGVLLRPKDEKRIRSQREFLL